MQLTRGCLRGSESPFRPAFAWILMDFCWFPWRFRGVFEESELAAATLEAEAHLQEVADAEKAKEEAVKKEQELKEEIEMMKERLEQAGEAI